MTPEELRQMHILCEQIAKETDHTKFAKLVQELNDLLEQKDHRLVAHSPEARPKEAPPLGTKPKQS